MKSIRGGRESATNRKRLRFGPVYPVGRRRTRAVKIGPFYIGTGYPIRIQSMLKCKISDKQNAIRQARALESCGCEIIRVAVKDDSDIGSLAALKRSLRVPLVADIHFNWRYAIGAIEQGVDKIRLNPGNIFKPEQVKAVARAAKLNGVCVRVGMNSGSLRGFGENPANRKSQAGFMVSGALKYARMLEKHGLSQIVISLKGSDIFDTINAYQAVARRSDYPLHIGLTATGLPETGVVKSSIALGCLLLGGIGDTIRVSLTDTPQKEIRSARLILESLDLRRFGPSILSCPACGRCGIDLAGIVKKFDKALRRDPVAARVPVKLAVMGCVVNGPGEARGADLGVAFGAQEGLIFKKGLPLRKVSVECCVSELLKEIRGFAAVDQRADERD